MAFVQEGDCAHVWIVFTLMFEGRCHWTVCNVSWFIANMKTKLTLFIQALLQTGSGGGCHLLWPKNQNLQNTDLLPRCSLACLYCDKFIITVLCFWFICFISTRLLFSLFWASTLCHIKNVAWLEKVSFSSKNHNFWQFEVKKKINLQRNHLTSFEYSRAFSQVSFVNVPNIHFSILTSWWEIL